MMRMTRIDHQKKPKQNNVKPVEKNTSNGTLVKSKPAHMRSFTFSLALTINLT